MSILGSLGNATKGALGASVLGPLGYAASLIDPTPGFSATNVLKTQVGLPAYSNKNDNVNNTAAMVAGSSTGAAKGGSPAVKGANNQTTSTTYGNTSGGGGGAGGGSGSAGTSSADWQDQQNALLGIDQGLGSANDALSRLGSQEQTGMGNVNNEYQSAWQQLLGNKQIAQRDYTTGRNNQVNEYESKRATNSTNARNWLDGALRTLGTQGAGGGSAARYGLPYQAQTQASQANATDQATSNRNLISLDTNWADTQDKYKNAQSDLDRQKQQGINDLQSKVANQRASILQTIAQLTGQRAIAQGGDYKSAIAAANGYTSQIPGILDRINSLSATPAITPQAVTVNTPTLDGYNYARPDAPVVAQQDPTLSGNPVLAGILGYDPTKDQSQQFSFA